MVEKQEIIIPNGRIIVKQQKKVQSGPMSMFVAADDEKLMQFAKELSVEAMDGQNEYAKKQRFEAYSKKHKKKSR